MNNTQMTARVGLFFILGVVLIYVTLNSLSKGKIGKDDGYTLVATFSNLKELKEGDPVRMAGVRIGEVRATRLSGRNAEAVLFVSGDIKVSEDAVASIGMAGLLGSNYVAIELGSDSAPAISAGGHIRTKDTPDLNTIVTQLGEIGAKVDKALSGLGGALNGDGKGPGLMGKLDGMIDENRTKIAEITTNLEEITTKINSGQGTIGKLVNDTKLHDELLASVGEIKLAATQARDFMANAQAIVDQVKSGQGTLGVLLYDEKAGENIKLTMGNLRELSEKLNKGEGTLGKLINDPSLYNDAKGALQKLDRAMDGMADQAPVSAVSAAAGALF